MSDLPSQSQTPGGNGAQPGSSTAPAAAPQASLSEADVRAIADRVYELLLADLAVERERRGGRRQ
jgi:hypothetical protein